jgi:SAM-dependent methyltransferase
MFMSFSTGTIPGLPFGRLLEISDAVAEVSRLRIWALLNEAELTVSELTEILRQSQPRVSRHLKILVDAELIQRTPEGAYAFFRAVRGTPESDVGAAILALVDRTDRVLAADAERLAALRGDRAKVSQLFFDANAGEWERLRRLHVADSRVETIVQGYAHSAEPGAVLDIGTGTGRMLELLGPMVRNGVGIDSSPKMLAIARANLERAGLRQCSVRHGDLYDLDFASGSFDLVVIHQVLHLLDDPATALREASRVLISGGTLLVVDFAPHQHEFLRAEQAHRRLGFGVDVIRDWFETVGLAPIEHQTLEGESTTDIAVTVWVAKKQKLTVPTKKKARI